MITRLLPVLIPLVVVALIALRSRGERSLAPDRLWIMPLLVTVGIGLGLYYTPHPPFGVAACLGLALAGLAGVVLLRVLARELLGGVAAAAVVADASMLFALGMVVALRIALWRRAKGLVPA